MNNPPTVAQVLDRLYLLEANTYSQSLYSQNGGDARARSESLKKADQYRAARLTLDRVLETWGE